MHPVCVMCRKEMYCEKNGFIARFLVKDQTIYDKRGDLYKCDNCGYQVAIGFGSSDYNTSKNIANIIIQT